VLLAELLYGYSGAFLLGDSFAPLIGLGTRHLRWDRLGHATTMPALPPGSEEGINSRLRKTQFFRPQ
jgi:hypothetical protein